MSIGQRLIFLSCALASAIAFILTTLFHLHTSRHLIQQLEKTLGTKCDEVITVLESGSLSPTLEEFLVVETHYRFSPITYFYQISDDQGRIVAKSGNLGEAELPLPTVWEEHAGSNPMSLETVVHPATPVDGKIRLRSERVHVTIAGKEPATVVIQTAASLEAIEATMRRSLALSTLYAFLGLGGVFLLMWFVTRRLLRPVSVITKKVSRITAKNLRERLFISGRGDELDELATVLNDMLDRLERSLEQVQQFSSDAAHQLHTPLTRIRGELDLILRGEAPEPLRDELTAIQDELERLSRICRRLLLLARLDERQGQMLVLDRHVDLEEVVSELLEQMTPLAQEHGVELKRSTVQPVALQGSRALLVEALLNLLHNAIRFSPEGGVVDVAVERLNGEVRISVQDTGPGVPPEERERIFQRFYRLPASSNDDENGSGLGLAIVKGIAQMHGGRVEVDPAPSGGSVFRLVLPIQ